MQQSTSLKGYCPYEIPKTSHLTPDNPLFHSFDMNLAILTKYGRYIFIRHGNQQKCSSFFATLATIVNKLEMSFGTEQNPAKLKKFVQGTLTYYVLKRLNFQYIVWDKIHRPELQIYSAIEFTHYQLRSCFTSKVNAILETNQTYDPTINFGKGRSAHSLLQYAIQNGLNSLPILFDSLPILFISSSIRQKIQGILNIKNFNEDGLQVSILMTMNSIISISKRKSIDIEPKDIFLFFNLLQSQSSLSKSENWFPICLPCIEEESMVFCYLNFIDQEIVHIMISDEASIFPRMSEINKQIKSSLINSDLLERISKANDHAIINDPSLQRSNLMKHFLVRNNSLKQMIMSKGQYFGDNCQFDSNFSKYNRVYATLYHQFLVGKQNRKQKLQVQKIQGQFLAGYYDEGAFNLFFIISGLCDFEEAKGAISSILKLMRDQQSSLFIGKYS